MPVVLPSVVERHWLQKDVNKNWEKLMAALESPDIEHNSLSDSIRHQVC